MLNLNDTLPEFTCQATSGLTLNATDFLGHYTVLYFYPKDNTPGCTTEGQDFSHLYPEFQQANSQIFGISKDSLRKHENFKAKFDFPFELISDPDETLCQLFDVIKLKKNFGKEYLGIERSTFLISPEGQLIEQWRKVSVKNHAQSVLDALKKTQQEV